MSETPEGVGGVSRGIERPESQAMINVAANRPAASIQIIVRAAERSSVSLCFMDPRRTVLPGTENKRLWEMAPKALAALWWIVLAPAGTYWLVEHTFSVHTELQQLIAGALATTGLAIFVIRNN